ncbi:hypothetical protein SAMN05216216_11811 [Lacicoccus qingdaonensis]|uniref:Uncharacterized protein n=1 Tax=Lacicoccus qingdaonensis TaxID=576118 RepID=A0A1G9GM44_9BACL|nr:hypothetical protein SAMN05216216_11811 [Salinicoccus qingdaonensis]
MEQLGEMKHAVSKEKKEGTKFKKEKVEVI